MKSKVELDPICSHFEEIVFYNNSAGIKISETWSHRLVTRGQLSLTRAGRPAAPALLPAELRDLGELCNLPWPLFHPRCRAGL